MSLLRILPEGSEVSLGWHRTRGARGPLVARVSVAVALPRLSDGRSRGVGAGSTHHVVPPAAPARALGPGVVQRSKLLGSFLQPEQKTRRVADDQGTQKGFSTGPGTSPALPPPREGRRPAVRGHFSNCQGPASCPHCTFPLCVLRHHCLLRRGSLDLPSSPFCLLPWQ